MSLTQKELLNLQKVGRIAKLLEKKKEQDLENAKFSASEYPVIKAGRASDDPKPLKNQISNLAELAQVIKQSREKQFELSQARILSELKQSEFFEKQAKPVVKAVEENAPDDNGEELKELKNRLLKIGMPLASILMIEESLKSVVESVSKGDSENDKLEMVSQYNALFKAHPAVSGFEDRFENVLNDYYGITSRVNYEKVKTEVEAGIPTLSVRLNEDDTRQLLNDSETGLAPEQIQKLIGYLLSKGIIDQNKPIITPPPSTEGRPLGSTEGRPLGSTEGRPLGSTEGRPLDAPAPAPAPVPALVPDDGERKAEAPEGLLAPVEPIIDIDPVFEGYKEQLLRQPPEFYIGRIESKSGLKARVDREVSKIAPKAYKKQLVQFIMESYVPRSGLWEEIPDVLPAKRLPLDSEPVKRKKKGRGLTMEDLRTKTNLGIRKKLGLVPPSDGVRQLGSPVLVGKPKGHLIGEGLNISNMTPAQLMNNLALNIASQKAGNSGVSDIINSIIDEMYRRKIISQPEHKKIWYQFCD